MRYQITQLEQVLVITFDVAVSDNNFAQLAEAFCHNKGLHIVERHVGLDRISWDIEWCNHLYSLNFEHYSEQVWIEATHSQVDISALLSRLTH
jgi:hypothetical protein